MHKRQQGDFRRQSRQGPADPAHTGRPADRELSVATSESWRDKATGERKEKTEWHRVVIFNEGLCQDRRAVPEERLEGLPRRRAADAQMDRPAGQRQVFHRSGAAGLQLGAHHARPRAAAAAAATVRRRQRFRLVRPTRARASPRWPARRQARRHGRRNSVLTDVNAYLAAARAAQFRGILENVA